MCGDEMFQRKKLGAKSLKVPEIQKENACSFRETSVGGKKYQENNGSGTRSLRKGTKKC
jgi:hypothetical protein